MCVLLGMVVLLPSPGAFFPLTRQYTDPGAPRTIRLPPSRAIVSRADHPLPRFNKILHELCFVSYFIRRIKQMLRLYNPNCRATQG